MLYRNLPKFNDSSYAHFVTTRTYRNFPYFKDSELCQVLLEELEFYSGKYGFTLLGYVIMTDHLHLLVWWDREEKPILSISKVMQGIKGSTARRIINLIRSKGSEQMLQSIPTITEGLQLSSIRLKRMLQSTHRNEKSKSHRQNSKYRLWQPGFYDFNIYSEEKFLEKLEYIHNNPVKAGLVLSPENYEWSSLRLYSLEKA